jgi:hypothetical protein
MPKGDGEFMEEMEDIEVEEIGPPRHSVTIIGNYRSQQMEHRRLRKA